jgi:hypothetical protein
VPAIRSLGRNPEWREFVQHLVVQVRIAPRLQASRNQTAQRFRTRRKIRLTTPKLVNRTEKTGVRSQLENFAHRVHAASMTVLSCADGGNIGNAQTWRRRTGRFYARIVV